MSFLLTFRANMDGNDENWCPLSLKNEENKTFPFIQMEPGSAAQLTPGVPLNPSLHVKTVILHFKQMNS